MLDVLLSVAAVVRYEVDIYEGRSWIGGKVASYVDKDGNHIEVSMVLGKRGTAWALDRCEKEADCCAPDSCLTRVLNRWGCTCSSAATSTFSV